MRPSGKHKESRQREVGKARGAKRSGGRDSLHRGEVHCMQHSHSHGDKGNRGLCSHLGASNPGIGGPEPLGPNCSFLFPGFRAVPRGCPHLEAAPRPAPARRPSVPPALRAPCTRKHSGPPLDASGDDFK